MICDLYETSAVRASAEARAQLMGLQNRVRVYQKAVIRAKDVERADLYRKAIKVTQLKIMEVI